MSLKFLWITAGVTAALALGLAAQSSQALATSATMLSYSDVSASAPAAAAINDLTAKGVVQGYSDGTYRPNQPVTRAEFLKALLLASGHTDVSGNELDSCFVDFTGTKQWYWSYACQAKRLLIVAGYPDGAFRGWKSVNLAEALKISELSFGIPQPTYIRKPDHWYDPYIDVAASYTLLARLNNDPAHLLTRGEMAIILDTFMGSSSSSSSSILYPPPLGHQSSSSVRGGEY